MKKFFVSIALLLVTAIGATAQDYPRAQEKAAADGQRVILFVGCQVQNELADLGHMASISSLADAAYPERCIVVSQPGGATWHATFPANTSSQAIRQAITPMLVNTAAQSDALHEVNAKRAQRGLRPYLHCPLLTMAANRCAELRARQRISGHLPNDFAHQPPGANASATGCAAWPPSMGWGSCAIYDRYTYAGAAYAYGADGLRYMHLFLR